MQAVREETPQWYVLRDLKRSNSKNPAYRMLPVMGVEVFTPMHWVLKAGPKGVKSKLYQPYIPSLLFARSVRSKLDEIIDNTQTLQYRFVKGAPQNTPMVVPSDEMSRFIKAVSATQTCTFYSPDELRPEMIGKDVMIKGGPLDGSVGKLLKVRGTRKRKLIVDLKGIIVAAVEVSPEFIELL